MIRFLYCQVWTRSGLGVDVDYSTINHLSQIPQVRNSRREGHDQVGTYPVVRLAPLECFLGPFRGEGICSSDNDEVRVLSRVDRDSQLAQHLLHGYDVDRPLWLLY